MGAWTVYLILTFNCDHRHLTFHPAMSCSPSLDVCHSLDASPARTTPKRTGSDISVAAAEEGHTPLDHESTPLDHESTPLDHESPPRKRQKTEGGGDQATSASNLGTPGSALLDLPLDVLLEVRGASLSRSASPSQASQRFGAPHRLRAPSALARSHLPRELTLFLADPHPRRPNVPPPRFPHVTSSTGHPHGPSLELVLEGELRQHGPWTATGARRHDCATISQSPRRPGLRRMSSLNGALPG